MCHSCGGRNPSCFGPAWGFLLGKREFWGSFWIPAFAGMTPLTRPASQAGLWRARGEAGGDKGAAGAGGKKTKRPSPSYCPPHPTLSRQGRGKSTPLHSAKMLPFG